MLKTIVFEHLKNAMRGNRRGNRLTICEKFNLILIKRTLPLRKVRFGLLCMNTSILALHALLGIHYSFLR